MKKPATNKKLENPSKTPEHSRPQSLEEIAATIERGKAMMVKAFYQGVSESFRKQK